MRRETIFIGQAAAVEPAAASSCPALALTKTSSAEAAMLDSPCALCGGLAGACARRCIDRRAALAAARRAVAAFDEHAARSLLLVHRPGMEPQPRLGGGGEPRFTLAISHSRGRAVAAAAARGARIGVDLERAGGVSDEHVRYFAGPTEASRGLDPTALWALKEAAWKALGLDAATPFRSLRLELSRGRLRAVRLDGARVPAAARLWTPWPGWVATLVELDAPAADAALITRPHEAPARVEYPDARPPSALRPASCALRPAKAAPS